MGKNSELKAQLEELARKLAEGESSKPNPQAERAKGRIVLLPKALDARLDDLTAIEDEANGVLLYRRQGGNSERYCPIVAVYMTAKGTSGHVQAEPQRIEVVNEFFQRHPDFHHVKFHTHSKGTIRQFGEYFAAHFSEGDIDNYREQLKHDSDFIGMVVTPSVKLLYAPDNPILKVVDEVPLNTTK